MKKIIKNSIKIMLICILICSVFYPIATAASRASFLIQVFVKVLDADGNPVQSISIQRSDFDFSNNQWQFNAAMGVTDLDGLASVGNFKLYPNEVSVKQFMLRGIKTSETDEECEDSIKGLLSFSVTRDLNDRLTILGPNDVAGTVKLENCSVEYSITDVNTSDVADANITVKLNKKEIEEPVVDCNVSIENIQGVENAVQVVSNANSANASISASNMVQYLNANGITIKQITDVSGNLVDLTSTQLIGTDTVLTSDTNKNYTTIVYGDATGDGKVDAADISVVINDFLGEDTNTSQVANIAADVQQDGELNAADISLMINSFLGNLQGDILIKK